MNTRAMMLLGLTGITALLAGCGMGDVPPMKQEGEIDIKANHYIVPKDGELYRVHNLKETGTDVFIFPNDQALADCYVASETGKKVQETCWPSVEAKVEDGTLLKALECHKSQHAVCLVRILEGHAVGVQGTIMWDWLKPEERPH
jgi:hypothetical protein